jgi:hypothetical protein
VQGVLSGGGRWFAHLVVKYLQMEIYKGVENVLFEIYEDLPEGGRITDKLFNNKLISFYR